LGLAGDAGDRELFFRSVEPGPRDASAVGWFGHPDLVDWLVGSLEAANEARRGQAGPPTPFEAAAPHALHPGPRGPRTGTDPPRAGLGAGQTLGANAAQAGGGLVTDAATWRAYWHRARTRFQGRQKLRFGRPYTPSATVDELESEASSPRAEAALEL